MSECRRSLPPPKPRLDRLRSSFELPTHRTLQRGLIPPAGGQAPRAPPVNARPLCSARHSRTCDRPSCERLHVAHAVLWLQSCGGKDGRGGDPNAMASSCDPAREEPMSSAGASLDAHSDTSASSFDQEQIALVLSKSTDISPLALTVKCAWKSSNTLEPSDPRATT